MRGRLIITALLALALHGCGSGENDKSSSGSPPTSAQQQVAVPTAGTSGAKASAQTAVGTETGKQQEAEQAAERAPAVAPAGSTFVPSAKGGHAPAVVFVHDLVSGEDAAMHEARALAKQGVASLVVAGAYKPTQDTDEFASYVAQVQAAVAELRSRPEVDPNRIALLGEGTGARLAAVVLGKEKGSLRGAVLADLGAAGGGSGKFAPERWLERARGSMVMLQRSSARDRTTDRQIRQLLLAAPPGTLVHEYEAMDAKAQAERDTWLRQVLQ